MRTYQLAGGVLALLLGSASAIAQATDPGTAQTADPAAAHQASAEGANGGEADQAADDKKWKFYTLGYVWLATAKGKTDVIGPVQPVDLDLSLKDVIDSFKFIFMGAAEARHDRFVILGDLAFVHLGGDEGIGIRDPDFVHAELDSRTAEITLLGGYRVINQSNGTLDLLAGGRMNFFKTTLQLDGPNRSAEGSVKDDWLDPLIAARAKFPIGGKWGLSLYGDVGGVIFGSDVTWQGLATVDYQISRKMNLGVGWRHWKVNYDHGDFLYDVRQTGPIIAFRSQL
jgi:hypothetical protein